jgi:hypothetical protein
MVLCDQNNSKSLVVNPTQVQFVSIVSNELVCFFTDRLVAYYNILLKKIVYPRFFREIHQAKEAISNNYVGFGFRCHTTKNVFIGVWDIPGKCLKHQFDTGEVSPLSYITLSGEETYAVVIGETRIKVKWGPSEKNVQEIQVKGLVKQVEVDLEMLCIAYLLSGTGGIGLYDIRREEYLRLGFVRNPGLPHACMAKVANQSKLCILESDLLIQQVTIVGLKERESLSVQDFSFAIYGWRQISEGFILNVEATQANGKKSGSLVMIDPKTLKKSELPVTFPRECQTFTINRATRTIVFATQSVLGHMVYPNEL